ncbi:hypothetical protein B0H14DRAFT_3089476 [Mycena olivaceomarginata]|nr:hypothetical protein B0H14DRAFT_3089476 [Mycena olivaceomarginata]
MAIATNDVPRIHAIIETAMRNGASVRSMANHIIDTFEGLHRTKSFTELELDLGILVYRLGGRSLLYAMNKAPNLPSLRTICNSAKFVKITPTIGPISADEIHENIRNVFLLICVGVTIMMDECALEEQAIYFSHANKVGGLCQMHSGTIPLTMATHGSVQTIVDALADGKVHFGKEMLFETWEDFKALFNMLIDVWGEEAAAIVGEINTFASDGDHLRRRAGHAVFMQFELGPGDKIYIVLSNLPGLNLFTGPRWMLMTFDWRHILKRLCTLLRHILGMALDNGRIVNPACLQRCLLLLPGQTEDSVYILLNPEDPQDVPCAILLLEAVVALRVCRIEFQVSPLDVNTNSDLDTITLLSFMVEAILNAFTDPSASLSKQINNLSVYAHMSFILFRNFDG